MEKKLLYVNLQLFICYVFQLKRDMEEKVDLTYKMDYMREEGILSRHLLRSYNDMIFHSE